MSLGCLRVVIVVFPEHTHLLFLRIQLKYLSVNERVEACFVSLDRQTRV